MQTMIIAYETSAAFARRDATDGPAFKAYVDPWFAYSQALRDAGVARGGAALQGPETATCLSVQGGQRVVEDGPYADAKEQIGGYFLIEVDTFEEALDWAAKCPAAETGFVDVHRVADISEGA